MSRHLSPVDCSRRGGAASERGLSVGAKGCGPDDPRHSGRSSQSGELQENGDTNRPPLGDAGRRGDGGKRAGPGAERHGEGAGAGTLFRRHREAEAASADRGLRLPHARLRQPVSRRPHGHPAATGRASRRLPAPAAAHRHHPDRRRAPSTYGTDNRCTLDGLRRVGAAHGPWRWWTRGHGRRPRSSSRTRACAASASTWSRRAPRRSRCSSPWPKGSGARLARPDPHEGRPDRRDRGPPQPAARADRVRSPRPRSRSRRASSTRPIA